MSLLTALVIAIFLPILSAKGIGWRGLWFGLSIAALVIAIALGSQPAQTLEQTKRVLGNQNISQEQYEIMENLDTAGLALTVGAFLGCLIAGCVYRVPPSGGDVQHAKGAEDSDDSATRKLVEALEKRRTQGE